MNKIDKKILTILQENVNITTRELAKSLHLSITPCWRRIKRLENEGYIKQKVALLDPKKIGLNLEVFINIQTKGHNKYWLESFSQRIDTYSCVINCYRTAGNIDYILHTVHTDMTAYDIFYKKLSQIDSITNISAIIVMEAIKKSTALPI
jgi:Lrp/AsnC family transcriptional regulator